MVSTVLPSTRPLGIGNGPRSSRLNCARFGRGFRFQVGASKVADENRDRPGWLYDITWLEYERDGLLVDTPLVAECEWKSFGEIVYDFEKLLLARAGVRLMIFGGYIKPGSKEIAKRLAERVREFNGSRVEDAWLLAAWETSDDEEKGWLFKYFTIEMNADVPF